VTSEEYENLLYLIRDETQTAAGAFYTATAINDFAKADSAIYDKLNRDADFADFWKLQVHGLQTAYVMGLGRLFDKRRDAHSVIRLRDATQKYPGFFSKDSLRTRKLRTVYDHDHTQMIEAIEASLEGVWEPTPAELRQICGKVDPSLRLYEEKYETIRHEIFGHIGKDQKKIANALSKTLLSDVDAMFLDLLDLMDALHALFDNGARHERSIGAQLFARDVHDRTRKVLDRL
jgi:hypothetical protein